MKKELLEMFQIIFCMLQKKKKKNKNSYILTFFYFKNEVHRIPEFRLSLFLLPLELPRGNSSPGIRHYHIVKRNIVFLLRKAHDV